MSTYKQVRDLAGSISTVGIQRIEDGAFIPSDPNNKDWQDYLTWAQTNTIAPADPAPDPNIELTAARAGAVAQLLSDPSPRSKFVRAVLLVILDEINTIRALLPGPPPPRTVNQMKTAIQTKVNSGAAD